MPEPNYEQGAYRRGVMLGLTLAELLLLLLFLFLLVATSLLFNRDEKFSALEQQFKASEGERAAFRLALGDELGLSQYGQRILSQKELETPLAAIKELSQQRERLEDQLKAARTELVAARRTTSNPAQEASRLREENAAIRNALERAKADAQTFAKLKARAAGIDPNTDPARTLETALNDLSGKGASQLKPGDPLTQCRAELGNANARVKHAEAQCKVARAGDYPPCVYRDDGRAAYVYSVSLTEGGAIVSQGDTGQYEQIGWVAALTKMPTGRALSSSEFISLSRQYLVAGDAQKPACRFYIRVNDTNIGNASREEFKQLYLAVQSNFYHHFER